MVLKTRWVLDLILSSSSAASSAETALLTRLLSLYLPWLSVSVGSFPSEISWMLVQRLCMRLWCELAANLEISRNNVVLKVVLRSKNTFIFSSDFETLFSKHSPNEILGLNFEKKTLFKLHFFDSMVRHYNTRKDTMTSFT